jgi:hypothetical protein
MGVNFMLIFGEVYWGNLVLTSGLEKWGKFYVNIGRSVLG